MTRVVFTCGDVNGIGPEIAVKAFTKILTKKTTIMFYLFVPKMYFNIIIKSPKPHLNIR